MRKLLLSLLAAASLVSCIDKDYDLSKVDTDDIAIGGDESVFRIPLVKIRIGLKDIKQGNVNIEAIFAETDTWLPDQLPDKDEDGRKYLDLTKANNDRTYVATLLDNLIVQMKKSDDAKCAAVAGLIWDKPAYKDLFSPYLASFNIKTKEEFISAFIMVFDNSDEMQTLAKGLAGQQIDMDFRIALPDYEIDGINIDDDIVDMLVKHLDTAENYLRIYGEATNALPVSLTLSNPDFSPTEIHFGDIVVKAGKVSDIQETDITESDLRQVVKNITVSLPVQLTRYYPGEGFDQTKDDQIAIQLRLVKKGGLDLKL